jgi:hemolysin III
MNYTLPDHKRAHSPGEEIASCVSHGAGLAWGLAAGPLLILAASRHGNAEDIAGAAVFAGTVVVLYLASTLYHALPRSRVKGVFRVIDHSAIYLLIAGTYTPFTLGILRGSWGWVLFGLVWSIAVLGVILKMTGGIRYPRLSTVLYMVMGWIVVIAIRPLWLRMPVSGWLWLLAGGLAYTGGIIFYAADSRLRYGHFIWHLFVLAGTVCHFFAVLWYAI